MYFNSVAYCKNRWATSKLDLSSWFRSPRLHSFCSPRFFPFCRIRLMLPTAPKLIRFSHTRNNYVSTRRNWQSIRRTIPPRFLIKNDYWCAPDRGLPVWNINGRARKNRNKRGRARTKYHFPIVQWSSLLLSRSIVIAKRIRKGERENAPSFFLFR